MSIKLFLRIKAPLYGCLKVNKQHIFPRCKPVAGHNYAYQTSGGITTAESRERITTLPFPRSHEPWARGTTRAVTCKGIFFFISLAKSVKARYNTTKRVGNAHLCGRAERAFDACEAGRF